MEQSDVLRAIVVIGVAATVLSFILYVMFPNTVFIVTFIIGIIFLVGGYIMSVRENKIVTNMLEEKKCRLEMTGYILCLDGTYVPERDDATIEYLE